MPCLKKSISVASLFAATTAIAGDPIKTPEEALNRLTGASQPQYSLCVAVTPYVMSWRGPDGKGDSEFHSFQINAVSPMAQHKDGACDEPNFETGACERGFVKITSTVPISCSVPVAL